MTAVVCVASGPSFSEVQARLICEARDAGKCRVLVVNRSWERVPNADVLYAADAKWWRRYWPAVEQGFKGECWTCQQETARELGLCYIEVRGDEVGLPKTLDYLTSGGNGGHQLIVLARKFLREWRAPDPHIVLVGYDLQYAGGKPNGRRHWHEDYPSERTFERTKRGVKHAHWTNANGVREWRAGFHVLARDLKADGIRVTNCTIETALTCWPRADLAETLA